MAASNANARNALVVEDDDDERGMWCKLLKKRGFAVKSADNVQDAKAALRLSGSAYCLFFIDIILPKTPKDAAAVKPLLEERVAMLSRDLKGLQGRFAADGRLVPDSKEDIRRHYAALDLDDRIAKHLNMEGGIEVIREHCLLRPARSGLLTKCSVPTLFLTGREFPAVERQAMELVEPGKAAWLNKPEPHEVIRAALDKILAA